MYETEYFGAAFESFEAAQEAYEAMLAAEYDWDWDESENLVAIEEVCF